MRYENANEVIASANKTHENLTIGSRVKITKSKRARTWKILGLLKPLPLLDEGGNAVLSGKQKQS
ncbi:MAG: hypothetical protein RQ763_05135 [Sulfurimonas sp.]|uniref:hypothetical protein n=1 Tax=Sulfurimonas sp. TaxID=2022749 RepID=UPI0028CDB29A|nr:hypothetical protein [Sulfurimonas sp.]MDT8338563.1 hypothetical protein [Sulfurimonas sp.]